MVRGHLLAAGVALAAAISPAASQTLPEIEYGYPEQPPRVYTNAAGQPDGYYPRLLKVLLARAGIPWHGASFPAPRLMKNLQSGETQLSILVPNPVLAECCLYSRQAVWSDELRVYWTGSTPPVSGAAELKGKTVITIAGFSYGGLITYLNDPASRISSQPAESHAAAFAMLDAGRGEYLLDYAEPAAVEGLSKHPIAGIGSAAIDTVRMYLVLSRSYPGAAAVMDRLEAAYRKLHQEDTSRAVTKP